MEQSRIKPSRWYYAFAMLVFMAGCGASLVLLVRQLKSLSASLVQVLAPGDAELNLAQAGTYTIFYEHQSIWGGRTFSTGERLSGLECELFSRTTGSGVTLFAPHTSSTYSIRGRSGRSIFQFDIGRPGPYVLSSRYADGQLQPQVVLAVGHEFTKRLTSLTTGSLILILSAMAVALAIATVTAIRRDKARRQAESGLA